MGKNHETMTMLALTLAAAWVHARAPEGCLCPGEAPAGSLDAVGGRQESAESQSYCLTTLTVRKFKKCFPSWLASELGHLAR